jgi:endonuclease/exonuclease/phosphatase family metal-dependent hydrolase
MSTDPNPRWRVLTWNLHGSAQPDPASVVAALRGLDPDIVALQEIRRSQARAIGRMLGWHRRWARKHYPYSPFVWWRAEGHAVMSRWPLTHVERTSLTPGVSTWIHRHRIVLAATVTRGRSAVRLYDVHLEADVAAIDARIEQAGRVADLVAEEGPPLPVVAGDLNSREESEVLRQFRRVGLVDHGGGVTSPSVAPHQRLDYVLVPETVVWRSTHTPETDERWQAISDHLPVVLEFDAP